MLQHSAPNGGHGLLFFSWFEKSEWKQMASFSWFISYIQVQANCTVHATYKRAYSML